MRDFVEKLINEITLLLIAERKKQGISHEKLAELAKVHRSTVSRIESKSINGTLQVYASMAKALGLNFSEIIKQAEENITGK